eukprot:1948259-Pyramimonas_sp.AAC.1
MLVLWPRARTWDPAFSDNSPHLPISMAVGAHTHELPEISASYSQWLCMAVHMYPMVALDVTPT